MVVSGMMATDSPAYLSDSFASSTAFAATSTQAAAAGIAAKVTATSATKNPNAAVESQVREYFADIPLMAEIAKCESRFRQFEKDGSILRGKITDRDVGVMQVNEYYHLARAVKLGYDLHTIEGNMAYARRLYKESGSQPWISSAPCWMKSEVAKAMFDKKILAEK